MEPLNSLLVLRHLADETPAANHLGGLLRVGTAFHMVPHRVVQMVVLVQTSWDQTLVAAIAATELVAIPIAFSAQFGLSLLHLWQSYVRLIQAL